MLVAEAMNRVSFLVLRDDMEAVVEEIAKSGVLHLTRIEEIDAWAESLQGIGVSTLSAEYTRRMRRLSDLIQEISPRDVGRGLRGGEDIGLLDLKEVDQGIEGIEKEVEPIIASRRSLKEKLSELKSIQGQIESLVPSGLPVGGLMRSSLLASAIGVMDQSRLEDLRDSLGSIPSVILPYKQEGKQLSVVVVVLRRDKSRLESALNQVGFVRSKVLEDLGEVSPEIRAKMLENAVEVEQELEAVNAKMAAVRDRVLPDLQDMLRRVQAAVLLLNIKEYCKVTDTTCLFSGWVPEEETEQLVSRIREKTRGTAVIEVVKADKLPQARDGSVEVPVLFKQPPLLRPFELLVSSYGTPSYRMIDPTVFVGITFLLMFGMMFGDVGHGLILFLGSLIVTFKSRKLHEAGKLGAYCGVVSMIFGLLYGSVFGMEHLLPALWLKPLEGITDLFKVAIGFGIVMVSLGIVLNIVNSLRARAFWENFFDKSGPLIGVVYWAGIGIVLKLAISGGVYLNPAVFYGLFVAPLAVFTLRGPLLKLMGKRKQSFPDGVGTYSLESVVEVMEILMGYLANTVSFIRVAAFGLAHAGLFVAVFSLARLVSAKPGGLFLSWVVLILGNVVIILLEGLVVTIQALRLEYYEFFGKFFKRMGSRYNPAGSASFAAGSRSAKGGE